MSNVDKISIALPREMIESIKEAVDSGDYATTSEVIRDAVREWHYKRAVAVYGLDELRRLVQEGADSGPSVDANDVFARIKAKYGRLAKSGAKRETSKASTARRKRS
jgi:antitoxin ParD1/3/4